MLSKEQRFNVVFTLPKEVCDVVDEADVPRIWLQLTRSKSSTVAGFIVPPDWTWRQLCVRLWHPHKDDPRNAHEPRQMVARVYAEETDSGNKSHAMEQLARQLTNGGLRGL